MVLEKSLAYTLKNDIFLHALTGNNLFINSMHVIFRINICIWYLRRHRMAALLTARRAAETAPLPLPAHEGALSRAARLLCGGL